MSDDELFGSAPRRLLTDASGLGRVRFEAEIIVPEAGMARTFLDYCAARRSGRYLARTAVQPRELIPLLPYLFFAELTPDNDLRYRLGGTAIVARLGVEVTGKTARMIFEPRTADRIIGCYRAMIRTGESMSWRGRYYGLGREHVTTEIASVPVLCADGETVQIFGGVFFPG